MTFRFPLLLPASAAIVRFSIGRIDFAILFR